MSRQASRAYRFVIAYTLLCFSASLISIWFPALGAYATYGVTAGDLSAIDAFYGFQFLDQFHGVRNDPGFVFAFSRAAGILTFPSVHAGGAVLLLWGAWRLPIVNVPFAVLNVAMAISAVSNGSHYLVDVIAGILLAAACIACTRSLGREARRGPIKWPVQAISTFCRSRPTMDTLS